MKFVISLFVILLPFIVAAQCGTVMQHDDALERFYAEHKNDVQERAVITIPVVVNIVYRDAADNISSSQINSQMNVLNRDYNGFNVEDTPAEFFNVKGRMGLQFCLLKVVRKQTSRAVFRLDDNMKRPDSGGIAPSYLGKALNIWVCRLNGGTIGYSNSPHQYYTEDGDGVVINTSNFGVTSAYPYNLGRTATHEIGHWLGINHLWGTVYCGDDYIDDTPKQAIASAGCPAAKRNNCGGVLGAREMSMNFMDYTNDACMSMFTLGQVARARANFMVGGARYEVVTANLCNVATRPVIDPVPLASYQVEGQQLRLNYEAIASTGIKIIITNMMGQVIITETKPVTEGGNEFYYTLPMGIYIIAIDNQIFKILVK